MTPNQKLDSMKLSLMIKAVESKTLPEDLREAQASLLSKLKAEKARYESLYEDGEVYRTPSMGIVELTHECLPEPTYLFGTDIRAKDIVRLSVFSASQDVRTGEIHKGRLLTEAVMSEHQFGEAIMQANAGSGYPVTLTYDSHWDIPTYDPEQDPTKKTLNSVLANLNGVSSQVDGIIDEMRNLIDNAKESGRLGAGNKKEVIHKAGLIHGHSLGNTKYHLSLFVEEMNKRSSEAMLSMHISANNLRIEHKE